MTMIEIICGTYLVYVLNVLFGTPKEKDDKFMVNVVYSIIVAIAIVTIKMMA